MFKCNICIQQSFPVYCGQFKYHLKSKPTLWCHLFIKLLCVVICTLCTRAGSSLYAQSLSACLVRRGWCRIVEGSPTSWTHQVGIKTCFRTVCSVLPTSALWRSVSSSVSSSCCAFYPHTQYCSFYSIYLPEVCPSAGELCCVLLWCFPSISSHHWNSFSIISTVRLQEIC